MKNVSWLLTAILLFMAVVPAQAAPRPLELKWNELANMIAGHKVAITLTDDTIVKGEVASIRDDAIVMDVTAPIKGYPKGNGRIQRDAVKLIDLERTGGWLGRPIGTAVGVGGGLILGLIAGASIGGTKTGVTVFFSILAGSTLAGHLVGRSVDRRVTHIKLVP